MVREQPTSVSAVYGNCFRRANNLASPVSGTMAHSWVMYHDSEYEAFKACAEVYPDGAVFLVDTYDVLNSGVPNAIKVLKMY